MRSLDGHTLDEMNLRRFSVLDDIGFYTLTDARVTQLSSTSPMWRCEILLNDSCNFKCPYCRGFKNFSRDCGEEMPIEQAIKTIDYWIDDGLKNVRFSGGEPTLYDGLCSLVEHCKKRGVERIAVSSNGSADRGLYERLLDAGVNDFSISLDACCALYGDKMAGVSGEWNTVVDNIRFLASQTYVTIGMVVLPITLPTLSENVFFASSLGVADIRIISAAQWNKVLGGLQILPDRILDRHPILKYRVNHFLEHRNVRGIQYDDSNRCYLVMDDSVVAGDWHFPCVIHLREGGDPIGRVGKKMRAERIEWSICHNTHDDPICKKNCLDVCIDYNNSAKDNQ